MTAYEDENRGLVLVPAIVPVLIVMSLVVGMRLYTRAALTHSLSWDDFATMFAFTLTFAEGVLMMVHAKYGQGRHWDTLSPAMQVKYLQIFYATLVIYYLALGVVKTAILLQYMRIFTGKMRRITVYCMVIIGMWSTAIWLVTVNGCTPVRANWDLSIKGHCIPHLPQWYINAGGNIITDLVIATLPIKVLWRLHLPKSQRLSLIGVFCLGFFTCAISIIRITALSLDSDISYKNIAAAIWSFAELACALITSSLPTLRPIMYHLLPRLFHPSQRSSARHKGTSPSDYARHPPSTNATLAGSGSGSAAHAQLAVHHKEATASTDELTYDPGSFEMQAGTAADMDSASNSSSDEPAPHIHDGAERGRRYGAGIVTTIRSDYTSPHRTMASMGGITVHTETVIHQH